MSNAVQGQDTICIWSCDLYECGFLAEHRLQSKLHTWVEESQLRLRKSLASWPSHVVACQCCLHFRYWLCTAGRASHFGVSHQPTQSLCSCGATSLTCTDSCLTQQPRECGGFVAPTPGAARSSISFIGSQVGKKRIKTSNLEGREKEGGPGSQSGLNVPGTPAHLHTLHTPCHCHCHCASMLSALCHPNPNPETPKALNPNPPKILRDPKRTKKFLTKKLNEETSACTTATARARIITKTN